VNIHVGNLAREVTEGELRQIFETFGQVAAVRIVTDRYSGVSRGFGFIEMSDKAEAQAAIEGLNMKEVSGRKLDISEARPPNKRRRDSGPHYGGGGRQRPNHARKGGGTLGRGGGRRRSF
jgi:RNA recognition motif-containing protein